jgi:hypothetical protein
VVGEKNKNKKNDNEEGEFDTVMDNHGVAFVLFGVGSSQRISHLLPFYTITFMWGLVYNIIIVWGMVIFSTEDIENGCP